MFQTNRQTVRLALLLALVVVTAGCVGLVSDDGSDDGGVDDGLESNSPEETGVGEDGGDAGGADESDEDEPGADETELAQEGTAEDESDDAGDESGQESNGDAAEAADDGGETDDGDTDQAETGESEPDESEDANGATDPSSVDVDELQADALEATLGVDSATFTANLSAELGTETSIGAQVEGAVDVESQRARVDTALDIGFLGQESMESTQYLVDDTVYFENPLSDEWNKLTVPNDSLAGVGEFERPEGMVELGQETTVERDTFDGESVYALTTELDAKDVTESIGGSMEGVDSELGFDLGELVDLEESGVSMTQYIDVDENYIRHVEADLTVDSSLLQEPAEANLELTIEDFNEEVEVELPEDAEDAEEFGFAMGDLGEFSF
jgi:hypothetical protein